jgi:plastocyanin
MLLPLTLFAALTAAKNIDIKVSDDSNALTFAPSTSTADTGDTVTFHFYPKNHNVIQGTFDSPCQPADGGFFSGNIPSDKGENGTTFTITVEDSDPIWYFCSEGNDCPGGMVGVINPS